MSDLLHEIFKEVLPANEEGDLDVALTRKAGGVAKIRLNETLALIPEESQSTVQREWLVRCASSLESGDFGHDFYFLTEEIIETDGILDFLKFAGLVVELFVLALIEITGGVDE